MQRRQGGLLQEEVVSEILQLYGGLCGRAPFTHKTVGPVSPLKLYSEWVLARTQVWLEQKEGGERGGR